MTAEFSSGPGFFALDGRRVVYSGDQQVNYKVELFTSAPHEYTVR